tara:strand:- start:531 stop:1052 length:522 start_codon:yes stop_codon:yes gene_type:complete
MAGDKKTTILDIVDKVDEMNWWKTSMKHEQIPESKIREYLVPKAMEEENPTAGGTYEGSVYYSDILPKGKAKTPWSKKGSILVKSASQSDAKKSDILAAQNYFVDIGYMHPSEVDGMKGKQLVGMIRRWNLNAGVSKEAMFDAMKTWKDRLFDGGAEDFEEDLREGGGDMGPY